MLRPSHIFATSFFAFVAALLACAPVQSQPVYRSDYGAPVYRADTGVVEGIDYVQRGSRPSGAGAVVGGIAGGVLGHQIGSGRGNTAATIAGAIGGAAVGNEIERRNRREDEDYRVSIRMDDGSYRDIIMPDRPDLRVGDRVIAENDRVYRR